MLRVAGRRGVRLVPVVARRASTTASAVASGPHPTDTAIPGAGRHHPTATAISFGEIVFDCFPDGMQVIGGAPFNVAVHLARFGMDSMLMSAIGDDGASLSCT